MAGEPILCFDGDKAGPQGGVPRDRHGAAADRRGQEPAVRAAARRARIRTTSSASGGPEAIGRGPRGGAAVRRHAVSRARARTGSSIRPRARAALERRLAEASGAIGDETLRRHYQADMQAPPAALFGDEPARRGRNGSRGAAAFERRGGSAFPPRGPRLGFAEQPLPPQAQALAGKRARRRARSSFWRSRSAIPRCSSATLGGNRRARVLESEARRLPGRARLWLRRRRPSSPEALAEALDAAGRGTSAIASSAMAAKMPNWWCLRPEAASADADMFCRQSLALHRGRAR